MVSYIFSIVALFINILIFILYYFKKNIKNTENTLFSILYIVNFMECLVNVFAILNLKNNDRYMLELLKKIDILIFTYWVYWLFVYMYNILFKIKRIMRAFFYSIICILISSIYVMNNPISLTLNTLYYVLFLALILFVILLILLSSSNLKNKKFYPLYILTFLELINFILKIKFPMIIVDPFIMGYIILVMYHTIDNPDFKMTEKLERANFEINKAKQVKSEFLSSMSHEIRTPLNAIMGFSEAIVEDTTVEDCHEDAKDIIMAGQNLLEIVNSVLDISNIEADKMEIINENYNLREISASLVKLIKPRIGDRPIDFRFEIEDEVPEILYGDCGKIKEIMTNLLTNAIKYTEEGFIDFKIRCMNNKDISTIFISVEDTGRGIKKEMLDNLFTKFQRLDEDKNSSIEGIGLGMAITKKLVDMMGGKIIVQSKYGKGSKFSVYLKQKIVSYTGLNKNEKKLQDVIDYSQKKILVVDDNALNLKVAARFLKEYGIEPETVDSGFGCLEKINQGLQYDLILMDDMMPKMSGTETFEKLRNIPGFNIPVVTLTANAVAGEREKYLEKGFNDYIAKPIDKKELKRVLTEYLK